MNVKELVLNEFHNLAWHCHKNDFDPVKTECRLYRFRGILWALSETKQITKEYRDLMSRNAFRIFDKAYRKYMENAE